MDNAFKTREQPNEELASLRQMVAELMKLEEVHRKAEEALKRSEEKYIALFENLNDAAFVADTESGVIIETNKKGELLLGRTQKEIIGMHQTEIHPPAKSEEYRKRFAVHIQKGHVVDYDGEVIRKDGSIVQVSISAAPLIIGGKKLIIGFFRDIEKLKHTQTALYESEKKYRSLVKNVRLGIFRSTPGKNGRFLEVNPAMEKITGYTRDELLRMNVSDLYVFGSISKSSIYTVSSGQIFLYLSNISSGSTYRSARSLIHAATSSSVNPSQRNQFRQTEMMSMISFQVSIP